ncbi:MAG: VPLPA-CTERM sorting domain-containing protein [Planctomycetota bacterium]
MKRTAALLAAVASAALAPAALAGLEPPPAGEHGVTQILAHLYGGSFNAIEQGYSNGSTTARYVDDEIGLNLSAAGFAGVNVEAVAKFSNNQQYSGYFDGNGELQIMFETTGYGYEVEQDCPWIVCHGEADLLDNMLVVGRDGGEGGQHSQRPADNADNRDHVITFEIDDGSDLPTFIMFWEDITINESITKGRSKNDFNDLVLRLSNAEDCVAAVPLPASAFAGIAGFTVLGLARRLKK